MQLLSYLLGLSLLLWLGFARPISHRGLHRRHVKEEEKIKTGGSDSPDAIYRDCLSSWVGFRHPFSHHLKSYERRPERSRANGDS